MGENSSRIAGSLRSSTSLTQHFSDRGPRNANRVASRSTTVEPDKSSFDFSLGSQERGVIISNPMEIDGSAIHIKSSNLEHSELRRSLLFWDKIVWPVTNGIHIDAGPDEAFLISEQRLHRPKFYVNGDGAKSIAMAFSESYRFLEARDPGRWLMSHGLASLRLNGKQLEPERGVISEFLNVVPIPDRDVPLEDVIAFKEKWNTEAISLREEIDNFYQSWVNSEDRAHQFQKTISRIERASSDMIRVSKESKLPFSMSSWKVSFNITSPDLAKAAFLSLGSATAFDLELVQSLLVGAAATVSIGSDVGLKNGRSNTPFNYVSTMEKRLY